MSHHHSASSSVHGPLAGNPLPPDRPLNRLLARLPDADFARLRPHLRTAPVKVKHVFQSAGDRIVEVAFPNGGVASLTTTLQDGAIVEAATIGDEGLVGLEAYFGADIATGDVMMQVPDTNAELLPVGVFKAEMQAGGALAQGVQRYAHVLLTLMMHSTACMARHNVEERCCRWLLMTHDRVRRDSFDLSHEFLAMMLGSTRPTVTVVAGTLQKAGLITYKHGRITILDRPSLEDAACECYRAVRAHFDRLEL